VTDPSSADFAVPLSELPQAVKAVRAGSFGAVASQYERYRPGPPRAAVDWILPVHVGRVVDLGAGTGALTRLLLGRADDVVAVEPDDRMRAVLVEEVPGVRALAGRGEAMPLPDHSADAVLASSSWHWMDPVPTLHEMARILVPGGVLAALWSGPDPDGPFMLQARALLAEQAQATADTGSVDTGSVDAGSAGASDAATGSGLAELMMGDASRPPSTLEIPPGVPFDQPDHLSFTWDMALNADELIGLLGTLSWIITMPEQKRSEVMALARRLLRDLLGVEGEVTVDVALRCETWRSRRHD
jgi:SAM-dependent methyltransferase